jgi:hypothetical protein
MNHLENDCHRVGIRRTSRVLARCDKQAAWLQSNMEVPWLGNWRMVRTAHYGFSLDCSVIQFTSHVFPPSVEYDCSKWGAFDVTFVHA